MAVTKRTLLDQLSRAELQAVADDYELDVVDRRSKEHLVDAAAGSPKVVLADVLGHYSRNRLKELCRALGLDDAGKEKQVLLGRLASDKAPGATTYGVATGGDAAIEARDRSIGYESALRIDGLPAKRPSKKKESAKSKRRTGGADVDAAASGSLKASLQQFALGAAGGYRGREAHLSFTTHLLECFGWKDGRPEGAELLRSFSVAEGGQHVEREVALWWPERRVLMEVVPHDAVLGFAWKDFVRVVLQLDVRPQYVVFTNQRDLHLYDLARDREMPRLSIPLDDLPRYSEAFPFFRTDWVHGMTPRIVNVEKVSAEVADLVAKLFRSVRAQHAGRDRDVTRFVLQCITAMFAEDIGLLPRRYFTSLLYEGAKARDVEERLRQLFVQMNTRDLSEPRAVPYFNGGLFTDAVTLPLGNEQLIALTKAAEADWTYVDPHIFGSVFQGIMDDAERHASGAHYTAHDDIMRVVGPTIVEPWRRRIQAAKSLTELTELRGELFEYRVLDPACGSGNFLYVAFREIYRLDTELLSRMREFPSTHAKLSWNGGIQPTNFFGIDINPFAVELAKVTLNIAKKIAFEERKAQAFALSGQVEIDLDPSLPLDNLDQNIVCADALFTEWPRADAIVSNPPYLGGLKIRSELGENYLARLQERYPGVNGRADFCSFWFRRAHDHIAPGGCVGLVATSTIREGNTREATLDYVVGKGGTIVNAVSSQPWPGIAVVNVSMVNWVKGAATGELRRLVIAGTAYEPLTISPTLQLDVDLGAAVALAANARGSSQGLILGTKEFQFDAAVARELLADNRARAFVKPVAAANQLLSARSIDHREYVVDMSSCRSEDDAKQGGAAFDYLKKHVYAFVHRQANTGVENHYKDWLRAWWRPWRPRTDFLVEIEGRRRIVVCSVHAARPVFVFISRAFFPTHSLHLFGFDDDYSFGVLQSAFHWRWAVSVGSKIKEDTRYTGEVWETFPWPQEPSEAHVIAVATAARALRRTRDELMRENNWSLRDLYQAADVPGSHPLKDAQASLDRVVGDAYGIASDQGMTEFLLELNRLLAEDEKAGRSITGPGLPKHLEPDDPRWMSADCIEPPSAKN